MKEREGRANEGYHNEILIVENALKDVELAVEPPAVDRVEDLGKDEGIEHESHDNLVALF